MLTGNVRHRVELRRYGFLWLRKRHVLVMEVEVTIPVNPRVTGTQKTAWRDAQYTDLSALIKQF